MGESINQQWAATVAGALVGAGVRHVVIAPGSRSTPLALAFAARSELKCWSVIDERSAAFFALGLSKSTGLPATVVCTSGTAGAHFLPAAMEACEGGTPLILLTADRPWELHGFGAPQTVAQVGLFGRFVRAAEALPTPDAEGLKHLAAVVYRTVHLSQSSPRGPVHLNVPFREPLAPERNAPEVRVDPPVTKFASVERRSALTDVNDAIAHAKRGLIVCGPRERGDDFGEWVHALSRRTHFPVIAEAASNARFGFPGAISVADALLRNSEFADRMKPDVVLRFGGGLTAKGPQNWLDSTGARIFAFTDDALFDPHHAVEQFYPLHFSAELGVGGSSTPISWQQSWNDAQSAVLSRLTEVEAELSEPLIARQFIAALPPETNVFLSSSMPIRDVDAFATCKHRLRVFANRGVNGIDGIVSTALGVAAGSARPTALLVGDVALLHDLSGLLLARRHGLHLTLVVVNNDGGGIFHFLPVAERTAHFEALFGTPHSVPMSEVAVLGRATQHRPSTLSDFGKTVTQCVQGGGFHVIEVRTFRQTNVQIHRELFAKLEKALP